MPDINTFRIEVVNEAIRDLFQTIIIRGKGFDVVEEYMSAPFIPTRAPPSAALTCWPKATAGSGPGQHHGPGHRGATTDFYSNVGDNPLYDYEGNDPIRKVKRTILKTPNTPLAYRRVEASTAWPTTPKTSRSCHAFRTGP